MTAEQPKGGQDAVQLSVLWRGLENEPVLHANQFVVQHQGDELFLTIGQLQPPILLGEPSERMEQARRLGYVPITVIGRFAFTRERLAELARILSEHLEKFDAEHRGKQP